MANNLKLPLNHKEGFVDEVPWTNLPNDLLMNRRKNVLFVGEGNFTFTLAFAALREYRKQFMCGVINNSNTWEGILSTRYEPESVFTKPTFSKVKCHCIEAVIEYYNGSISSSVNDEVTARIEAISALPELDQPWLCGIDACAIPLRIIPSDGVIWFQCPWDANNETSKLIQEFLLRTAERVDEDFYVCIGLTKQFPYITKYHLQQVLGWKLQANDCSTPVLAEYKFLGANDTLIKEILSYGYRHKGLNDIHKRIIRDHVTLIFQKKPRLNFYR